MLGQNNTLAEDELISIFKLEEDIRDSYKNFNPIVHLRDYEKELQTQTEILIDLCQIYLLKLLQMREYYFKKDEAS